MSHVVCPYCFERFDRSTVSFRCTNQRCTGKTLDRVLRSHWDNEYAEAGKPLGQVIDNKPGFLSRLLGQMPESAVCPTCNEKTFTTICPHCHNRIPREMVEHQGHIISIIGAKASGKTNYITVLIRELIKHGHLLGGMGITAVNVADDPNFNTQSRYQKDFYGPLYEKKKAHEGTAINDVRTRIPLIYELSFPKNKPVYLVLYDTAGENFFNIQRIADNVKYLKESDAILFLLDTFNIPSVHDTLGVRGNIDLRYNVITDNVITFFKDTDPRVKESHFKTPLALVFSKIDAILNAEDRFQENSIAGMSLTSNSAYLDGSPVRLSEIDSISMSIQAALGGWCENNFVTAIANNYKNYKYFGISALGDKPDSSNGVKDVKPYRVLDPLVWILTQIGCKIPVVK